jgi:hypothetical protein
MVCDDVSGLATITYIVARIYFIALVMKLDMISVHTVATVCQSVSPGVV